MTRPRPEIADLVRSPLPSLGDALDFLGLLWGLDQALQRSSRRLEAAIGITGPQRLVLRIIGKFPGIPPGHLAALLRVHPGTLSGMIKRLERQGMVSRRADPRDGRRTLLGLTEKGRTFDVEVEGSIETAVRRTIESSPAEGLDATRQVLASLTAFLSGVQPHQ